MNRRKCRGLPAEFRLRVGRRRHFNSPGGSSPGGKQQAGLYFSPAPRLASPASNPPAAQTVSVGGGPRLRLAQGGPSGYQRSGVEPACSSNCLSRRRPAASTCPGAARPATRGEGGRRDEPPPPRCYSTESSPDSASIFPKNLAKKKLNSLPPGRNQQKLNTPFSTLKIYPKNPHYSAGVCKQKLKTPPSRWVSEA